MQTATEKNRVLDAYTRLADKPFGKKLFSLAVCRQSPFFASIAPTFVTLAPGHAVVAMKKRKAVQNHIGTVHALAVGNLCELAAGTMMEASLPRSHRWIPKGMQIEYLAKAGSDLVATCTWAITLPDVGTEVPITVHVTDEKGAEVTRAVIRMWVSPKKSS